MRAIEIRQHLRKEPFRPFRIFLSNGIHYDIHHPELMYVGRTDVVIALKLGKDDIPDELAYCNPVHVTNIEPLANGGSKKSKRKRNGRK